MIKYDKKINQSFQIWLLVSFILVFSIIIVGGLTRLTNSGLSIVEWELFKGIFPPLNEASWNIYFESYKSIPQYEIINFNMSLKEFKIIFYWEYFHRLLARLIGIFFLIPLIYFHISKKINRNFIKTCYLILFLIIFQGIVGWYMVKSGLVNDITVSHYRLSLHLITALIIISSIFWLLMNLKQNTTKSFFNLSLKRTPILFLLVLVFIQIIVGAFVSGLDAGRIYQTWPLMGYNYMPDDVNFSEIKNLFDLNNHSLVQFYHRNIAYLITLYIAGLSFFIFIKKIIVLYKPILLILFLTIIQIFLGIVTLLSGLNIYLASAHQITGVLLVLSTINLYYFYIK